MLTRSGGDVDADAPADFQAVDAPVDASQSFAAHELATLRHQNDVVRADLDGDKDLDILVTKGDSVLWRENDGRGSYTDHEIS